MTGTHPNVDVLSDARRVAAVLSPIRRRLLQSLEKPDSASGLARRLNLPRQKINYHLRELERAGFVELAEERQQRGCTERLVRVTARAFLISEDFLGPLAATPESLQDNLSSAYLVAAAARAVREVATLRKRAASVQQKLATMALETEIHFESPAAFNSFSKEVAEQLAALALKYNQQAAAGARKFRVLVASHPVVTKTARQAQLEARKTEIAKKGRKK